MLNVDASKFMSCPVIRKAPSQTQQKLGRQYLTDRVVCQWEHSPMKGKTKRKLTCRPLRIFAALEWSDGNPWSTWKHNLYHRPQTENKFQFGISVIIHEAQTFHPYIPNNENKPERTPLNEDFSRKTNSNGRPKYILSYF